MSQMTKKITQKCGKMEDDDWLLLGRQWGLLIYHFYSTLVSYYKRNSILLREVEHGKRQEKMMEHAVKS